MTLIFMVALWIVIGTSLFSGFPVLPEFGTLLDRCSHKETMHLLSRGNGQMENQFLHGGWATSHKSLVTIISCVNHIFYPFFILHRVDIKKERKKLATCFIDASKPVEPGALGANRKLGWQGRNRRRVRVYA